MATYSMTTNRAKNSSDGAEVLLEDEHEQAGRPGDQQRAEVLGLGQQERPDPAGRGGQQLVALGQVGGEEDGQGDLGRTRPAGR